MQGYKNDEMTARWTQFGIYSPIMRLHSSSSEFNGKEPWRYCRETELVMGEALRERHRMMPYLYTMNYRSHKEGLPVVMPMYYEHPEEKYAYRVKNQYYFGSEMIVAPITSPRIKSLNVSRVTVWLPEGIWYDIHTGNVYEGGRLLDLYRDLTSIPVLAKAGGILPFTDEIHGVQAGQNPASLRIKVFAGADGSFCLYEDDNDTCGYEEGLCVTTQMTYTEAENALRAEFCIEPARGQLPLIPQKRSYTIELIGFGRQAAQEICLLIDGENAECRTEYDQEKGVTAVSVPQTEAGKQIKICLSLVKRQEDHAQKERDRMHRCFVFLDQAEIEFGLKDELYSLIERQKNIPALLAELHAMKLEADLYGVLTEILAGMQ